MFRLVHSVRVPGRHDEADDFAGIRGGCGGGGRRGRGYLVDEREIRGRGRGHVRRARRWRHGGRRGVVAEDDAGVFLAFAVEEFDREPFEDVVHDGLGHRDFGVLGEAARLEAGVGEFVDQELERDAVLQGQ